MSKRPLPTIELVGFEDDEFDLPAEQFRRWFESPVRNLLAPNGQKQIDLFGEIGRDIFTGGGLTPAWLRDQLAGQNDVTVNIDSPGGSFWAANSMYSILAQHEGTVTVNILGVAASAASLVAMSGDKIRIVKNGAVFIHNAHGAADGDHRAMTSAAENLRQIDKQIRTIYSARTGLKDAEVLKMMDGASDGTMMVAQQAIDKGFADEFLPEENVKNLGVRRNATPSATLARRALEAAAAGKVRLSRNQHRRYFEVAAKLDAGAHHQVTRDAGLFSVADELRRMVPATPFRS